MATLIAPENNDPIADAEAIRKAVHGFGTNEKAIISIVGHRNAIQRKMLKQAYEETFQENLTKRFESELSGNLEKAVFRWMLDPADRDAVLINTAMKQSPPDYRVIVEFSSIYSPEELLAVKRAYQARYKHSVEEDLAVHISGDLGKFLLALVGIYRYDGEEINARLAKSEATVLNNAINDKIFNHVEVIRIISTRSKAQLIGTLNRYKDDYNTSITKHLVNDPADQYLAALRIAIRCVNDPHKYYEKLLRNALNQHGTDEDVLTRVIVTRAEKDLKDIKELYYKRNTVTLDHAVGKKTSGDYKAFLLTLLGKED
ncbi:hypothetical protein U1Q18_015481 [Sarracenia purpurea var. burkii]